MENILEKVYSSGLKFLVPLTTGETYSLIVQEAIKLVKADNGTIFIEQQGELKRVYASSPVFYKIKPRKKGFTYKVFKNRIPLILSNKQIEKIHPQFKQTKTRSDIIVPLYYKSKSIGVISVQSKTRNFSGKELNTLKLFVPLATLAIRKTQLYDETKKALEVRDKFIAMASHELRTPLTSVIGYVQLLKSKLNDSSTPEARWIEQLALESNRLNQLVKELLEINSIKSGQFQYNWTECSLKKLIEKSVGHFKLSYPSHQFIFKTSLEKNEDITIGDFDKLLQTLINVLDNAIKFSAEDATTEITLTSKSSNFNIKIKDQGVGITKKDLKRIFEGFYKSNELKQGLGLGLYLTKDILKRHHGDLKIISKKGEGTTVNIILPKVSYG